jgi:signal transduction histidine kinase
MRTPRLRADPIDVVVALALTLAVQGEIWAPGMFGADTGLEDRPLLSVLSLAICLPLAVRRTWPWAVAVIALGAEVAMGRLATPPEGLANLLAMLVATYSLGRFARRPGRYAGIALVAAAAFGVGEDLADNVFVLVVLGGAWAAGVLVARRTDDLASLELRRLEASRAGAEEERLRIARELHDVVTHRVSMMVVQSQVVDTLLEKDPVGARTAIHAVEQAGRDALTELRSALGLLHQDGDPSRAPGDTDLARLDELADMVGSGGLPVSYNVTGTPRQVPPAVAMAAFRIVQESLTNVVKHAGKVPTRVELSYAPTAVGLTIEDDGAPVAIPAPGHGLAGMAERASFLGGTLSVGPRAGGGFRVAAVLPTPAVES